MKRLLIVAIAAATIACQETRPPALSPESQKAINLDLERESADLVVEQQMGTIGIKIKTLYTEDEINRLEGRPSKNRLAIAKLEGRQECDQMLLRFERSYMGQLELLRKRNVLAHGECERRKGAYPPIHGGAIPDTEPRQSALRLYSIPRVRGRMRRARG